MPSLSDKPNKIMTSLRLTPEAMAILRELARVTGASQAVVVEMALRDFADARKVKKAARQQGRRADRDRPQDTPAGD